MDLIEIKHGYHNKRKKVQVTNSGEDRESYRGEM